MSAHNIAWLSNILWSPMILRGQFMAIQVCPSLPETWEFIRMFGRPKFRGLAWVNMGTLGPPISCGRMDVIYGRK